MAPHAGDLGARQQGSHRGRDRGGPRWCRRALSLRRHRCPGSGVRAGHGHARAGWHEPRGPLARRATDHTRRERRRDRCRRSRASLRLGRDDDQQRAPRRVRVPRRTCGEAPSRDGVAAHRGGCKGGAMRLRMAVIGLGVTVAGLGLVACGDDSASSSQPESLTVTASEPSEGKYAFDLPDEVTGGTVTLTLKNEGAEPHELGLVKVADGTTAQQFVDDVLSTEGAPIPEYVIGAPGGLGGVGPSASGTSTISLDEGTYVYFCNFGDPPHYQNGMLGEFTVKDVGSTAPLPDNAAEVDASEYKFDASGLKAGENTFTFANKGQQFHHLIAVKMNEGATLDDVAQALSSDAPPDNPPADFDNAQDLAVTGPGEAQSVTLTFDAGSYVFLCFLSDREGGPPHFTKGMVTQVD